RPDLRVHLPLAVLPAQLASFRQKRAKSNAGEAKKTQKRKSQADPKNDSPTQDCHVEPTPPSGSATETNHKVGAHQIIICVFVTNVLENRFTLCCSSILLDYFFVLVQLQLAVEKRNEIIAKLSSNLQDALASRDLVQLEAHSLADQIRALQKQLQQVTVFPNGRTLAFDCVYLTYSDVFRFVLLQSGAEVLNVHQHHHHSLPSQDLKNNLVEELAKECPDSHAVTESFNLDSDGEINTILHKLRFELEEEKKKNQRISSELAEEMEKKRHVLSLLEKEKQGRETQLSQVQTQCLVIQQYKEEKDREIHELRLRLHKEENGESSGLYLQNVEDERQRQEEEIKRLKEEHRKEIEDDEIKELKASENHQSPKNVSIDSEKTSVEEANVERGPDQDSIDASIQGDILMERYLASAPLGFSQSSAVNESFEQCKHEHFQNISFQHNINEADLEKDLLNQQCLELQEELALKERELDVLKEEVLQSAEELEEARSRCVVSCLTEELRHALWELEEEKQKRRDIEEEMKTYMEDRRMETGTLIERREEEDGSAVMIVEEAESSSETFLLTFVEADDNTLVNEVTENENKSVLVFENDQEEQTNLTADSTEESQNDYLTSELEKTKAEYETTSALLTQKTVELEGVLKELETTRAQVVNVQKEVEKLQKELLSNHDSLQWAEKVKSELEAQILCLQQNLTSLEEAQTQSVQQREEAKAKEQQMEEQIKKMEQVLEEELEQFESILKAKDVELADEREKWEMEKQEKEQLLDETSLLREQVKEKENEVKDLTEKHQQEISKLNTQMETELTKLQAKMEEEQKRQISLIKQVTEREHERVISELTAKHKEELNLLRAEVSLELRESMEAAHQAELQQIQVFVFKKHKILIYLFVDQVVRLEEEKALVKQNSEEEVGQLWTQLESMRASRRELGELKEQLLARSSHVDDIERLKTEFNEQKQEIKEQNEAELENLRRYFEKRLHASEESYKEEIALLQMRLVESALEESVGILNTLKLELEEKHALELSNMKSSMAYSFKEELQQVRLKLKKVRSLQQKISIERRRSLFRRFWTTRVRTFLEGKHLLLFTCQIIFFFFSCLFCLEVPHSPVMKPETQYDTEPEKAKNYMSAEIKELTIQLQKQSEERLHQAQQRFQEEKAALEQQLVQKYESSFAELKNECKAEWEQERMMQLNDHSQEMDALNAKHHSQLNSLAASHKSQLAAVVTELESKHHAELVALEAVFQETNQVQLEALEAELSRKHQEEMDELEKRMLGNMDTLEATYLKEVQEKHKQELIFKDAEHKNILEQFTTEQMSVREELRKELAQVHMEKFKAMAAELSFNELASQKEALDAEHCKALEALKKQVFDLEQHHNAALEDLTNTYTSEKDQLTQQFNLQLQELRGTSARELEAARRELEESSSRQRQHYLEEVELLKVRSEEKLQDKINQLMTEFEAQKEVELEDLRRSFASDQQEKEQSYTNKMSQLTVQLQQLDAVVAQLRAEVGCLQGELQGKSAEMETMDTLLQRRERESQEGANLLQMLTDDLQAAKEEKFKLHHTNEKLAKVLVEMFRSIRATEEQIGQKINTRSKTSEQATQQRSLTEIFGFSGISVADLTSDDLEMTQLLCESLLVSDSQINPVGEESVLNACCRLRQAVDMLLDLLNQANTQLEETRNVHLSLEEKFSKGKEDSVQLLEQHKLLLEQLDEEAKLKSQLQLELHKAEGLLEGYVAEKAVLEESLQQKENREERLVEELEDLKMKLKHQELIEENASLLRQKDHLSAGLGEREKALLAETERLTQDRLDLQRQAEKDHKTLTVHLRHLERELEEQETKVLETELHNKTHTEDLNQRVQALEKQLKHDRQFIEEQAVEREHERDEFQQEIRRLEAQLRQPTSVDNRGSRLETLNAIIKDKTEDYDSLMTANQQAQRDLAERNEEIDKLAGRIRELEQALLNSAESVRTFQQLEQELHKVKQREQELKQDKLILEQQQLSSRLQISALQSKLDETRHCYHDNAHDPTHELRDALDTAQQKLHSKEQEVRICTVQKDLSLKEVELKHLTLQLQLLTERNAAHVQELQEQISYLKEKVSTLTINAEEKEEYIQVEETEEETLPSALILEKNQEIDHLSSEVQRLEQELESARDDKALEGEIEDLRSQVERLQSEIARVRHDKQEEEERLHEVISTLQAELATLGPNLHEVSDSQDGDSFNPSPAPSPEPRCVLPEQETGGKPSSLKHELNQTHSASSHSLRSRLRSLQSQLETAAAEKESLERLLLTQEEEYRGQGEEFGKRLKAERKKLDEIQDLLKVKEAELEEEKETRKLAEKERDSWKAQVKDVSPSHEEMAHLQSLVLELQKNKQEMKTEMEILREAGHTLERQVQEMRIKSLEATRGELSAECELLRRREGQLLEEIVKLESQSSSMKALIQDLTMKLKDQETRREEDQKAVLTHADVTLAKADAALRQKELEFDDLKAENQVLRSELTAVKHGLSTSSEKAHQLHEEGQTKDRALVDLETDNRRLKAELQRLQKDLTVQEEELAYQQRELQLLRQHCHEQNIFSHHQEYSQKSQCLFSDTVALNEASLSSPEVLRRLQCSEDRIPEHFHTSVLDSHLSGLSGVNSPGLDPPKVKISPRVVMEPLQSRTITPDPSTQRTHSPGSLSVSDNFSLVDSIDAEKVHELEGLDQTAPPSPFDSASSISAQEWASDGYGSNVSSELGARLKVELEQTERLDAQFVEYLRCRGMNPAVNTDSAAGSMSYSEDLMSPELQGLLRKVYHESCKILTLSQRRVSPSVKQNVSLPHPPMSWQQEKRALQETVIALRELLCRMAQRHSQVSSVGLLLTLEEHDEALQREKARVQELQRELEQEKALNLCKERDKEEQREVSALFVKKLNVFGSFRAKKNVKELKSEVLSLKSQVKQEMVTCSNLRQELQIEQSRSALLEKRLEDTLKILEDGRQHSLADSHRKIDDERERCSQEMNQDRKFISDLRSQLEQERRQGEGLADAAEKLRTELLQSRRKWEEEDKTRREELQREQDAAAKHRVLIRTLKEQKREISCALEAEQERRRHQEKEVAELKERLQLLKNKEKEMEEQWERETRKIRQEQMERERRQERTKNKLLELQSLRQQDQQRVQELQQTLAELEKEEKEMAAQRQIHISFLKCSHFSQQMSSSSSNLLETLLKENSELNERIASFSQERSTYKHRLSTLEKQLRRTENELSAVSTERENRPINDPSSSSRLQRYYERYLRAESFRKALVYQKRYLLLLLGGFQECEQATLCLIARMGARPSTPLSAPRRPIRRFRAAVQVVVALSRMKFLTRKWQKAIRRPSLSATGHAAGPKVDVLRQQQPRSKSDLTQNRESNAVQRATVSSLVPPSKSPFRLHNRSHSSSTMASVRSDGTSQDPERSLTEYIHHLEKVQQRLVGAKQSEK
uniref:Pericentrin n=1 Tax=Oryzias melastigma TaxID=30732 RepID=A0A3B3DGS5_ORYME